MNVITAEEHIILFGKYNNVMRKIGDKNNVFLLWLCWNILFAPSAMTLNHSQYVCFAGFVDVFTDSKEAVVNHGHKLLKVGFKYH